MHDKMIIGHLYKKHNPTVTFVTDDMWLIDVTVKYKETSNIVNTCYVILPDISKWMNLYLSNGYNGMIRTKLPKSKVNAC